MAVKHGLTVLKKSVTGGCWREWLDLRERNLTGCWRKLPNEKLRNLWATLNRILLGRLNQRRWDWRDMWHACERWEIHTVRNFSSERENVHLGQVGVGWKIILKWILEKYGFGM